MKKTIKSTILLFLSIVPILTYSQIRFGIRGTEHTTSITNIHKESKKRLAGSLGALVQISLDSDNQFYIQPEISYSLQGEKDKGNKFEGNARNAKYFQNYINIPIYFRAYFSELDSEFFGEFGPQIGFLIYQKEKNNEKLEYGYNPKNIDVSIGAGIGYSLLRKSEFFIRYNYGLVDIYDKYIGKQRTSILAVGIAYVFD